MSMLLVISILIRLAAMWWSVLLLRQLRDWRMGFLTIMLGLMALRQIFTLWNTHESWTLVVTGQATELPGLIVSIMAFLAVFFLKDMLVERKQLDAKIVRFSHIFEESLNEIYLFDVDSLKFIYANMAALKNLGYTMEELQEMTPVDLKLRYTDIAFAQLIDPVRKGEKNKIVFETFHERKDKSLYYVEVHLQLLKHEQDSLFVAIIMDITERMQAVENFNFQASHDPLTGLTNRREFERRVEHLLVKARQDRKEHALCFMDLDQFKVINDTCGHLAGDELLRQIGSVLQSAVSHRDTLARLGGDEFGILLEHCSIEDAQRVTTSLQKAIQNYQFLWEGRSFKVGVSLGLVPITNTTANLTELLKEADIACYMAKDKGRNCIHVSRSGDSEIAQRHGEMQWVTRINQAIEENRFRLYAQSIVPLNGSANKHYELLIKMIDEDGKTIPPGAFLPAAERFHLISKIDHWVIENAFVLLRDNPAFLEQISFISINLSGSSLTKPEVLNTIIDQLNTTGIDGGKICFEITETAAITNMISATKFISTLKGLGCPFALDDFGSGLSSFGYLKNLPVDYLKIDGMFVKNIVDEPIDHSLVKSINEIGQVMGMQTIAECVENDVIMGLLKEIGVNYGQGYGIARPLDFRTLLIQQVR
jgi:diguanylate cyclase (GGDEF)-like protein/PAS domain S-box-containing protein